MSDPPPLRTGFRLPQTLRALRHRNYQLLVSGQIFSLTGSWIQSTAQGWLVYRLTSDAFLLGLVGFAAQVPVLALGLFTGVIADSVNRHRLIMITQVLLMVQAFTIAALTLIHGADGMPVIEIWHIILLATFAGVVQAFDLPARQAFMVQIVPREDLGNAIALNSLTFNAARVIGPSLAGILIALLQQLHRGRTGFGEGMCFLINGFSFVAVLIQVGRMKLPPGTIQPFSGSTEGNLAAGLRYLKGRPHLRALMYHAAAVALFGLPYLVLLPVYAKDILHGDSRTLGWLTASVGIGAMTGGVMLARRRHAKGMGKIIAVATGAFAVVIVVFSWLTSLVPACLALMVTGFCMVSAMISSQTLVQTLVSEQYRGRVMSFYSMMTVGMMPFGSLISGAVAKHFGAQWAFTICGIACAILAVVFAMRIPAIRRAAQATPEYENVLASA
jgi:MFS family permease